MGIFGTAAKRHAEQLEEQALYERAANELASGNINKGLYAKALALSGSPERASAMYLKLRVKSLLIEDAAFAEMAVITEERQEPRYAPIPIYEREPWPKLLVDVLLTVSVICVAGLAIWWFAGR
jgi:hypothetical protein